MNEFIEKLIGRLEEKKNEHLHDEKEMNKLGKNNFANFCCAKARAINGAISIVNELAEEYKGGWISAEYEIPPSDAYILLSFSNFSVPLVGRYEEDEYGGAFYIGDEDESCASQGVFVNAWQPLPEPYKSRQQSQEGGAS